MRTELTAEEVESYRDNGFLVIDPFLDADELEEWRAAVDEATQRPTRLPGHDPVGAMRTNPKAADAIAYYERVFTQRVNLWQTDERMRRLVLDPRIGKVAATLEGIDGIRLWHDQALVKEPWANPTGFHLDVPRWSFSSPHAISLWVALDDATMQNGCMGYLPGSHKAENYERAGLEQDLAALFTARPDLAAIDPVFCPLRAGGAAFHNGLTAHGAGPNMTRGRRRAMTMQMMPDGATYNGVRNILPPELVARLDVGDLLDDETQNPLLYRRAQYESSVVVTPSLKTRESSVSNSPSL